MQGGRNSQRCRRLARNVAATRSPCAALSSTDLLSSSPDRGTPLGALDDLGDALRVERGIAGQSLHERLAVTFAEPIEQLATYERPAQGGRNSGRKMMTRSAGSPPSRLTVEF